MPLMRTSLLIRDGLRKENAANLHRQTATHWNCAVFRLARIILRILQRYTHVQSEAKLAVL